MYGLNIVHLDHCNADGDGTGSSTWPWMTLTAEDKLLARSNAEFNLTTYFYLHMTYMASHFHYWRTM